MMSQEFPNGVSYFTDGEISLTVHFPEDKVKFTTARFVAQKAI